jgi:hypothetical protein
LKTVSTATCGDRDLSAPPYQGRLTGQGSAPAGNRAVRFKAYGHRALSLPPLRKVNPARAGRPFEAGWMGNHWGSRPRPSAISRAATDVSCAVAEMKGATSIDAEWSTGSSLAHTQEVGRSIRPSATNMGRYARGQSSGAVNAVPLRVRRFESVPCPPRGHSSMAELLLARQKTSDRNRLAAPIRPVS